ncbi:MAG: GtrA family protein, partial [Chitinophagaceae bacterium]|nr:GtrA family protein [Chitinophagaceae bacterium]
MTQKNNKTIFTFLKVQVSSIVATAVDFLITIFLAEFFHVEHTKANICGVVCGGVVNFLVNRQWAFRATEGKVKTQIAKYIVVWLGSILLNIAGFNCLTKLFHIEYILAKIIVAVLIGVFYNYLLQKKIV